MLHFNDLKSKLEAPIFLILSILCKVPLSNQCMFPIYATIKSGQI